MPTAIVRQIDDKQIVGVFAYPNNKELFWLVDQVTDPYGCEYVDFDYGGIAWYNKAETLFADEYQAWADSKNDEDAPYEQKFDGASLDDYLWQTLCDADWISVAKEGVNYHGNTGE